MKRVTMLSPLGLLGLAACGGASPSGVAKLFTGTAIKAPLNNALVFVDANGNGKLDAGETSVRTGADGTYQIANDDGDPIVVVADSQTTYGTSGVKTGAFTMTGAADSGVITPFSGLQGNVDPAQVSQLATALGLPSDFDFINENPFAATSALTDAQKVEFEQTSSQMMSMLQIAAAAAQAAASDGAIDENDAFAEAFDALVEEVVAALDASGSINFLDPVLIQAVVDGTVARIEALTGEVIALNDADLVSQIQLVNQMIEDEVTDISDETLGEVIGTGGAVAEQYVADDDGQIVNLKPLSAKFVTTEGGTVAVGAIGDNAAANSTVGWIKVTDVDNEGNGFAFAITGGADAAKFAIDAATGEVTFVGDPDASVQSTYDVEVTVTEKDAGGNLIAGNTLVKPLTITLDNVDEGDIDLSFVAAATDVDGVIMLGKTASVTATASDVDGIASETIAWYLDGVLIAGASGATYTPVIADIGKVLSAKVTVVDGSGADTTVREVTIGEVRALPYTPEVIANWGSYNAADAFGTLGELLVGLGTGGADAIGILTGLMALGEDFATYAMRGFEVSGTTVTIPININFHMVLDFDLAAASVEDASEAFIAAVSADPAAIYDAASWTGFGDLVSMTVEAITPPAGNDGLVFTLTLSPGAGTDGADLATLVSGTVTGGAPSSLQLEGTFNANFGTLVETLGIIRGATVPEGFPDFPTGPNALDYGATLVPDLVFGGNILSFTESFDWAGYSAAEEVYNQAVADWIDALEALGFPLEPVEADFATFEDYFDAYDAWNAEFNAYRELYFAANSPGLATVLDDIAANYDAAVFRLGPADQPDLVTVTLGVSHGGLEAVTFQVGDVWFAVEGTGLPQSVMDLVGAGALDGALDTVDLSAFFEVLAAGGGEIEAFRVYSDTDGDGAYSADHPLFEVPFASTQAALLWLGNAFGQNMLMPASVKVEATAQTIADAETGFATDAADLALGLDDFGSRITDDITAFMMVAGSADALAISGNGYSSSGDGSYVIRLEFLDDTAASTGALEVVLTGVAAAIPDVDAGGFIAALMQAIELGDLTAIANLDLTAFGDLLEIRVQNASQTLFTLQVDEDSWGAGDVVQDVVRLYDNGAVDGAISTVGLIGNFDSTLANVAGFLSDMIVASTHDIALVEPVWEDYLVDPANYDFDGVADAYLDGTGDVVDGNGAYIAPDDPDFDWAGYDAAQGTLETQYWVDADAFNAALQAAYAASATAMSEVLTASAGSYDIEGIWSNVQGEDMANFWVNWGGQVTFDSGEVFDMVDVRIGDFGMVLFGDMPDDLGAWQSAGADELLNLVVNSTTQAQPLEVIQGLVEAGFSLDSMIIQESSPVGPAPSDQTTETLYQVHFGSTVGGLYFLSGLFANGGIDTTGDIPGATGLQDGTLAPMLFDENGLYMLVSDGVDLDGLYDLGIDLSALGNAFALDDLLGLGGGALL